MGVAGDPGGEGNGPTAGVRIDSTLRGLIDAHSAAVYRLARSIVRDVGLSDDVTQETFIKVWKHLDDFRGDGSIRGWILRIAHRESISALRRQREAATDPALLGQTVDPTQVSRVVEGRFAYASFQRALDLLDELSRAVLVLRELEGLSYEEIANVLDVPVPTVKTRLLRARRSLQVELGDWKP